MSTFGRWFLRFGLAGFLAVALGYLPYRATGGIGRAMRLQKQLTEVVQGNGQLERDNRRLREQVRRLKQDHRAVERVARDELGLIHPEDVVFQFD